MTDKRHFTTEGGEITEAKNVVSRKRQVVQNHVPVTWGGP